MNRSFFSITRYMNTVCFKVSGGTPVPKLPPSYPPPPPESQGLACFHPGARYMHITIIFEDLLLNCLACQSQIQYEKVQVGKDQEKAQSEKDSHSKNRGGKKPN